MNYKVLAIAALVSLANSACTPLLNPKLQIAKIDPQAIYEQNTGKRITQAKVLAQVAVGYGKLGQQEMATKLLSPAIQTAKVNSSIFYQTEMWGEVGASYVKMGRYNDALQAAKSLATQKYQGAVDSAVSIALDRMIRELVAAKQLDKATQVAQLISHDISSNSPGEVIKKEYIISKPRALTRLADEYTKAGQREKALKVLAQIPQRDNPSELTAIAVAYAAAGQRNQALQLLAQATRRNDPTNSMSYFIEPLAAYDTLGQRSQALQLLAQAKDEAKQKALIGGPYPMMRIAIGYAEIGEYNQAFQIAKTPQLYRGSDEVFTQLAGRFAEAQQYNLALQAIQEIKGEGNELPARAKLAVEYARAKQYDRAFQTLSQFEQLTFHGAFTQVVETVVRAERGERAVQLLAQALEVADNPNKPLIFKDLKKDLTLAAIAIFKDPRKDLALAAIASGYAEIGQREQAEPLLAQAHQIAEQIREDAKKAVALATIAGGYADIGQKEQAELLLTEARQIGEGINR